MAEILNFDREKRVAKSAQEEKRLAEIERLQAPIREAWFKKVDEFNAYLDSMDENTSGAQVAFRLLAMMKAEKKYRDDMNAIDGGRRTTVLQDALANKEDDDVDMT